jgi:transcription initiation factor IIF auxiliary subunit
LQDKNKIMATKISPEQVKKMNKVAVAQYITDIGIQVSGAFAAKTDEKRKQQFYNYLTNLSDDQQNQFINAIENAKTDADKYALVAAVLNNANAKRVENLSNVLIRQEQENRQKKVEKIILGTILGAMVIVLIYINRKK